MARNGEMSVRVRLDERIAALEAELVALRSQLPAHSVPPGMLMRIDELEDELARLRQLGSEDVAEGELSSGQGGRE